MNNKLSSEESQVCEDFIKNQEEILANFIKESSLNFSESGKRFQEEYKSFTEEFKDVTQEKYQTKMKKLQTLFQMYRILKNKCQHKVKVNDNLAQQFYLKNLQKTVFNNWATHANYNKYLTQANNFAKKEYVRKFQQKCLTRWRNFAMEEIKLEIKYKLVRKSETEISKVQKDYENIIKSLENTLQKRLFELKEEEESHKMLFQKYDILADSDKSQSRLDQSQHTLTNKSQSLQDE